MISIDILQQVKAAKSAIKSIEANIFTTHLDSCIKEAFKTKDPKDIEVKINEIKDVFKKDIVLRWSSSVPPAYNMTSFLFVNSYITIHRSRIFIILFRNHKMHQNGYTILHAL